ncbi:MAG: hemin uptake protein HemP [Sulfurovum sp.]|nr:hemin uptake protein HemP [Sulfurovum sp.]MDQ1326474.1 Hemin uptake protein hemP [Campylobacterota bacterium]
MKNNQIKAIDSQMLFDKGEKIIHIIHDGVVYTLRITKENKLILTK